MERVADEAGGRLRFQLYTWPDRETSYRLVDRVHASDYEALIVTVDTPVAPNGEYDPRNGFSLPLRITRRNLVDVALHPRGFLSPFACQLLRSVVPMLENYPDELRLKMTAGARRRLNRPKNDSLRWADLRDLQRRWRGPLLLEETERVLAFIGCPSVTEVGRHFVELESDRAAAAADPAATPGVPAIAAPADRAR